MKRMTHAILAAFAAALLLSSMELKANGTPPPPPPPPPPVTKPDPVINVKPQQGQGQRQGQRQQQGQGQGQGQKAVGQGTGTGEATAGASNDLSIQDGDYHSDYVSKALAIGLPALAFTPPLPMIGCPTSDATQSATGVLFGVFSHAEAKTSGAPCYKIIVYNSMLENCEYESARRFKREMAAELFPKFAQAGYRPGSEPADFDLTPRECSDLKKPVIVAPPAQNLIYEPPPTPPVCTPEEKKKVVVAGKKCVGACCAPKK